jgi:uridylate kinase
MGKKVVVMSLGGSVILSNDPQFLLDFRKTLKKNYSNYKFVIVCGGGSIARQYINVLKKEKKNDEEVSRAGIRATRMNAQFLMQVFGKEANDVMPLNMKRVKSMLHENNVVICGSLRYASHETSDGTAAKVAAYLKAPFINVTNVDGLYTADPRIDKKATLIPYQTWTEFEQKANKMKFKPGQHFVLDQTASHLIRKKHIHTFIVGKNMKQLDNLINGKAFIGTTIGP